MEIKICFFVVYIIEALILSQYTSTLFYPKYKKYIELPFVFALYTVLYCLSLIDNYWLNICSFFFVTFLFMIVIYQTKIQLALFHTAISTTVMAASELIIFNIISHYTPDFFADTDYFFNMVILAIFSKLLYFLVLYVLSHLLRTEKDNTNPHNKATFLLSLVPVATVFILMTLITVSTKSSSFLSIDWMLCISSFLMLGLNIFIFSFHHYVQKENTKRTELELLLQKEYDSTEYYKMLLQQNETQNILVHDMKKHLQSIAILCENKDYDKISLYISHLFNSSALQNDHNLCEHKILNSILSQYKKQCKDKQIDFQVDIRHSTFDFMILNDLTALFCNLLDNAVEASEELPDSFIELSVSHKKNTPFTIITMTNSCRQNPFDSDNSHLFTRKTDKRRHGYGLKSIQRIVKKYHGNIKMYYDNESITFHTIITLKQ